MTAAARAAFASGSVMWAGMGSAAELEEILDTGAKTRKIIKPYRERKLVYQKIEHAKRAGALAAGMDIDHAFGDCMGYPMRPVSLEELRESVKAAEIPFVVKGVLSVQDAEKCARAGAAGIVVSHHHGIIRGAMPPLRTLPEIKRAVGSSLKLFADCGIDDGVKAFKALALGADAVSTGRAAVPALKQGGAEGLRQWIEAVTEELAEAMDRTGSADLSHIDPGLVHLM